MQRKVHVQRTGILGGVQSSSTKGVRQVIAVKRGGRSLVDGDTVRLDLQGINRLRNIRVDDGATSNHRLKVLMVKVVSVKRNGLVSDDLTLRTGRAVELLVGQEGQTMPIAVLVGVGSADVLDGAETDVHGLNGPLQLRQQLALSGRVHARALEAVHADEGEADALDVNVVTTIPGFRLL